VITAGVSAASCPASWNQTYGQNTVAVVTWKNVGVVSLKPNTAIFDPGLYYLGANGLTIGDNSTVRMSTATGDGNSGAMFYFSTGATISVGSNAGKFQACTSVNPSLGTGLPNTNGGCIVSYKIDGTASTAATGSILSRPLQCSAPGSPPNPAQVPSLIDGNILLGPCSGTYGDPTGQNRGFLFFQNRATAAAASWGGGAGSLVSGFLYFHNTSYGSQISMSGGSSSAALSLGNMVADRVTLVGGSGIKMILNPQLNFQVLRPTLLQ
jgi:hypothetical protein